MPGTHRFKGVWLVCFLHSRWAVWVRSTIFQGLNMVKQVSTNLVNHDSASRQTTRLQTVTVTLSWSVLVGPGRSWSAVRSTGWYWMGPLWATEQLWYTLARQEVRLKRNGFVKWCHLFIFVFWQTVSQRYFRLVYCFDFSIFNDQMSLYNWFAASVAGVILLEMLKMFGKNMNLGFWY